MDKIFLFEQKTKVEEDVKLAYSIMCHGNLGLLEALMSTIFRPQNIYCIYVDDKSPTEYKKSVRQLAAIYQYHFPQVFTHKIHCIPTTTNILLCSWYINILLGYNYSTN